MIAPLGAALLECCWPCWRWLGDRVVLLTDHRLLAMLNLGEGCVDDALSPDVTGTPWHMPPKCNRTDKLAMDTRALEPNRRYRCRIRQKTSYLPAVFTFHKAPELPSVIGR